MRVAEGIHCRYAIARLESGRVHAHYIGPFDSGRPVDSFLLSRRFFAYICSHHARNGFSLSDSVLLGVTLTSDFTVLQITALTTQSWAKLYDLNFF